MLTQTVVFEELAENDDRWLYYIVVIHSGIDDHFTQRWMTRGLTWLRELLASDLRKRLDRTFLSPEDCASDWGFLTFALENADDWRKCDIRLRHMIPDEVEMMAKPPFYSDADPGPSRVWHWSHQNEYPSMDESIGFVLAYNQALLRQCGYVFLGPSRLDRWGVMHVPFVAPSMELTMRPSRRCREFDERMSEVWLEKVDAGICSAHGNWYKIGDTIVRE